MTGRTIVYTDTLFYPALIAALNGAQSLIELATYLFRTDYLTDTSATAILNALIAAAQRGVRVLVILNYSRFEPTVAALNYATAELLVAAGCHVRLGPVNQTMHSKVALVDMNIAFAGSHNITRGGLSRNREFSIGSTTRYMVDQVGRHFYDLWQDSIEFDQGTPPGELTQVVLTLGEVTTEGAAIRAAFAPSHTDGVDAFAAIASALQSLEGAVIGPTVTPTERVATVVPNVNPGADVYVAVRAYSAGQAIATSDKLRIVYQPTETPPGGDGDPGGGDEPPPPEPLTAPTLTSVTPATGTTVTYRWSWIGTQQFRMFTFEQRDLTGEWRQIGASYDAQATEWAGTPLSSEPALPFRTVVHDLTGNTATSNEVLLTGEPPAPLTAPHLESVVAGLNGTEITVTWTFPGCENFHRFEVQKEVGADWSVVGSTLDPSVRQWVGPGPGAGFTEATYRVVVFNIAEESAASNEITITGEPPVSPQPPVLVSVTQIGPMGINVEYSHVTPAEFARYEVQQRTNGDWSVLGTITTPETRSWSGGPVPYMDTQHPVRVVVFVQSGDSAGSNEMVITPM